jgi:hypothetical protein
MYFTLENGLAAGGFITITAPTDLTLVNGACNMWALDTTKTAPVATSTSWITGTLVASTGVCTLGTTGLTAGTAYGM